MSMNLFDEVMEMAEKSLIPDEISDEVDAAIEKVEANPENYRVEEKMFRGYESTAGKYMEYQAPDPPS